MVKRSHSRISQNCKLQSRQAAKPASSKATNGVQTLFEDHGVGSQHNSKKHLCLKWEKFAATDDFKAPEVQQYVQSFMKRTAATKRVRS
jgi:hypothetical protein